LSLKKSEIMTWPGKKSSSEYYNGSARLRVRAVEVAQALRQNHAMEHATIAILIKRLGSRRLLGLSTPGGFYLVGDVPTEALEKAAGDALRRLREGEDELAVSLMCGTNLVVTGLFAGMASMVAGKGHRGLDKLSRMAVASMLVAMVAPSLGKLAQEHVTTNSGQDNVTGIRVSKRGNGRLTRHKVEILRS